MKGLAIDQELT